MKHPILSLFASPPANTLAQMTSAEQPAPGVDARPEQAASTDQAGTSSALSSQARSTGLKLDQDLTEAFEQPPQQTSLTPPVAVAVPAEARAPVPVTLSVGLDAASKIDPALAAGFAPAPAPTDELSGSASDGFEPSGRGNQRHPAAARYPVSFRASAAVAADSVPFSGAAVRTPLSDESRSSNKLDPDRTHPAALTAALKAQAAAARAGESPRGELAFAARLVESVEPGSVSQTAARPDRVAMAASHPSPAPLSRPEPNNLTNPAALASHTGPSGQSQPGVVASVNAVDQESDEPRHTALKSSTSSDDSGPGRTKTSLEAGEKFKLEAGAREAAPTMLEPAAGKPAGASAISGLEPARAATPDRNPERGDAPRALGAPASTVAAAAEKSAAIVANAAKAEPVRDVTLRLTADQKANVEVRLIDRGGEVRVSVRSADPQLAESMRAGLSDLSERLSERGFKTDIWRPEPAGSSAGFSSQPGSESPGHHQDSRQHGGSGQHAGRNPSQQQQPGQQHQQRRPQWVEELEHSLSLTSLSKRSLSA